MLKNQNDIENKKMDQLDEKHLKKLQMELLDLLKEIDRICKKRDIKYTLSSGTLLGAIRHGGFIPWDDDADVAMLREEYDKFCIACETELDTSKYFWQTKDTDKEYRWVYGKLRLKNTAFVRKGQEHLKQMSGIFVDVFPIDNSTNNKNIKSMRKCMCSMCRKVLWSEVGYKYESNMAKRMFYKGLKCIPRDTVMKIFDANAKHYNNKETKDAISYNFKHVNVWGSGLKREWFEETIPVKFENETFECMKGYDELLTGAYGDYMELPPIDERVGNATPAYIRFTDGEEVYL